MTATITVQPNQSLYDVIIQATGSINAGWQFCIDNGLGITEVVQPGTVYNVTDAALALGDANVRAYLIQNRITVGTMATAPAFIMGFITEVGEHLITESGNRFIME